MKNGYRGMVSVSLEVATFLFFAFRFRKFFPDQGKKPVIFGRLESCVPPGRHNRRENHENGFRVAEKRVSNGRRFHDEVSCEAHDGKLRDGRCGFLRMRSGKAFAIEFIRHEQDEYERQYRYLRSIHLESVEHPRPLEGRKEDDGKEGVYAERKRFSRTIGYSEF